MYPYRITIHLITNIQWEETYFLHKIQGMFMSSLVNIMQPLTVH